MSPIVDVTGRRAPGEGNFSAVRGPWGKRSAERKAGEVAPGRDNSITCSSMTAQEFDVIVVGSGAAGLVAALTAAHQGLSAVVVEKAPHFGGSTARSGGGVWIPNNEILKRDGVTDTKEAARTYLHAIIGDVVETERIDTYLDLSGDPEGDLVRIRSFYATKRGRQPKKAGDIRLQS